MNLQGITSLNIFTIAFWLLHRVTMFIANWFVIMTETFTEKDYKE